MTFAALYVSSFFINKSIERGNSIFVFVAFIFWWIIPANATVIFAFFRQAPYERNQSILSRIHVNETNYQW